MAAAGSVSLRERCMRDMHHDFAPTAELASMVITHGPQARSQSTGLLSQLEIARTRRPIGSGSDLDGNGEIILITTASGRSSGGRREKGALCRPPAGELIKVTPVRGMRRGKRHEQLYSNRGPSFPAPSVSSVGVCRRDTFGACSRPGTDTNH